MRKIAELVPLLKVVHSTWVWKDPEAARQAWLPPGSHKDKEWVAPGCAVPHGG